MVRELFKKNIKVIEKNILNYLNINYPKEKIDITNLILLNEGKFANATVFEYKSSTLNLTIKDFSGSPWIIRNSLGRFFINSEYSNLLKLKNNPSIAKNIKKISNYTLVFDYIEGCSLKCFPDNSLNKNFFLQLEKNIKLMHQQNIIHLDLRNLGNIIVGSDNYPYIIDFQSAISPKFLNRWLKNLLQTSDLTGVYKSWKYKCNEPLDFNRNMVLEKFNKIRKIWIFKGYPISKTIKKIKNFLNLNKI